VRYHVRCTVQKHELMHVQMDACGHGHGAQARPQQRANSINPLFVERETQMHQTRNGMPAGLLPAVTWQKSSRSNPIGNCVELALLPDGAGVAIRNSRDPEGPALIYTPAEITAFIEGAKEGDFDQLVV
jgi:Domain of unknown function (DUF397)